MRYYNKRTTTTTQLYPGRGGVCSLVLEAALGDVVSSVLSSLSEAAGTLASWESATCNLLDPDGLAVLGVELHSNNRRFFVIIIIIITNMTIKVVMVSNDVKFHKIFGVKYFMKYFVKYFTFFSGSTLTHLIFFICQTLPFIHLCILQLPKPICRSTCLVCLFKYTFYPRDAILAPSLRQRRVRPSVCPSGAGIVPSRAKAGS